MNNRRLSEEHRAEVITQKVAEVLCLCGFEADGNQYLVSGIEACIAGILDGIKIRDDFYYFMDSLRDCPHVRIVDGYRIIKCLERIEEQSALEMKITPHIR